MSTALGPESDGDPGTTFVAGHRGMVGSAIVRRLGDERIDCVTRTRSELDLTDARAVNEFFERLRPTHVFMAAAKVGGIHANASRPGEFIYENLAIQVNVLEAARRFGVQRLIFLGSSCVYPRDCPQPIREDYLLTGPLERTNRAYAVAKISGIETCGAYNRQFGTRFLAVMPTNLYGPNDNYDPGASHVLPALIRRFHEAKLRKEPAVTAWGTGAPRREFLNSDELADACVFLMRLPDPTFDALLSYEHPIINVGCSEDLTIRELSGLVREAVGFEGDVVWDASKPDGTPRKLLDVSRLSALGWRARLPLRDGIALAYRDFLEKGKTTT